MAPSVRTAHPRLVEVGAGRCAPQRTDDAGGGGGEEGRCLRSRAGGAAGMLGKSLLSAAVLSLLLVRCSLAAEENTTYDASGSLPLPSGPAATGVPAHPLAEEEVPFPVVHSDGDSEPEGEGLSGRPAFSSVLTVMAGTVKNLLSLDESRTLPTIARDETHTTQWPSRSSSQDTDVSSSSSSSSSYASEKTVPDSSVSLSSSMTSLSSSAPSASFLSSSIRSVFFPSFSSEWINKAASSQGQSIVSGPAPLTETAALSLAGFQAWRESKTTAQSTRHAVADLLDATRGIQSTTTKPSHFPSRASIEKSNKVTKHFYDSSVDKIHGVSKIYVQSAYTKAIQPPATSRYKTLSTFNDSQTVLKNVDVSTETQSPNMNSAYGNNHGSSILLPFNQESQATQKLHRESPASVLLSAHPEVSSHVTQQMLNQVQYMEKEDWTEVDGHALAYRNDAFVSPLASRVVKAAPSPPMTFTRGSSFSTESTENETRKRSLSAITRHTLTHSDTVSSEHASNPGDLLMAAGHKGLRVPAMDIIHNQQELARTEHRFSSSQAYLNNSVSLAETRPESTSGPDLRLSSKTGKLSSTPESDLPHLLRDRNVWEVESQTGSSKDTTPEPSGWMLLHRIFSTRSRTPLSELVNPTHKTMFESSSHPTQRVNLYLSDEPEMDNSTEILLKGELKLEDQPQLPPRITPSESPRQTESLLGLTPKSHTPVSISEKSEQTVVSSAEASAHIRSHKAFELQTSTESNKMLQVSSAPHVSYGNKPTEVLNSATAKSFHLFNVNEELTQIRDTVFYKKGAPSGQFTTRSPSFVSTKGVFTLNEVSEASGKKPAGISFSPKSFDAASERLESLSNKADATLASRYEHPSSSSWSKIFLTQRTNSSSHSPGTISSVRKDKSDFYFDRQTAIVSTVSSAVTTSSGDGQNSLKTSSFHFSSGTKQTTPYIEPMSPHSSSFKSLKTSTGFDWVKSNVQADGQLNDDGKLGNEQESNVHTLNSADSTVTATHPHPSSGQYSFFRDVTEASNDKKQSLNVSPVNLSTTIGPNVQQDTTRTTAAQSVWGSDGFLSHTISLANSVKSSQTASLASLYKSKHSPPLADLHSTDSPARLSDNPSYSFLRTETISPPSESVLKRSTLPARPLSSHPFFHSSLLSSTQLSSFYMKHTTFEPSSSVNPGNMKSSPELPAYSLPSSPTTSLNPDPSQMMTEAFVLTEAEVDELTAGTSREVSLTFPKEKEASLAPSQSVRITLSAGPSERTPQVSPLDTTTASVKLTTTTVASPANPKNPAATMPSLSVATPSATANTPQPTFVTKRTTTTTTIRTQTSRRTFTPPVPRVSPPRVLTTVFISPFTTTTETPPQQCNITERLWVKTVVSIYVRRNRLDSIQRQNLRRGLSQGLRKALNDTLAQAQVETVFGSPNMTVAYHVTGGDMVYSPSVVLEGLASYGRDKLIADLRQYLPMVTALPRPVALWRSGPATGFQLKTVLQFVGGGDNPRSCRFSQMMEQRLEKVFAEAQAKVLKAKSRLSVQMLSVSQAAGSPAVSLVYTVRNGTVVLNGTTASNLLGQLSAELVGYFLFYPPLIIAEPMEYHNLNTSIATRDYWVVTVIQDVDNASLEGQYQSFASLMEQRLAELFVLAGGQGTRFKRATTVGSYTVQMVSIRRVSGAKNPAEMTYYIQHNGIALSGTSAAKVLNTVDSQTMALTLGYFIQLQAEPVVKNPPNNLWILAAVLAPISVVTLIIIIITAVLCRKNKNDFKADAIGNLNPRAKMAYRRDVGYYHQPVQGFDYAKQHLGQQGGDEETLPASQDTLVMSLQIRDTPLSLEKALQQDGTANKKSLTSDKHKSKLPSEDGSVISNESERLNPGRGLTVPKVTAQQKLTKEETRKRDDPYDTSSGSLQLISIKPMAAQNNYSHSASSARCQDSAIVNGEVNMALKQKSDIEHYRNKLRLKAKRKGYYDFPSTNGSSGDRALVQRQRHEDERAAGEHGRPLEPDDERGSTYVKSHRRHSQVGQTAYRSRQSLSSPSPGGTEMDLLVMRERPRRGIRNSGYDTEPELIEETNVDRLMGPQGYMYGRGLKGHSETSTLSSQPSIDEVRQQMHLLLEEAFSLASGGQSTSGRHSSHHHHHHPPPPDHYSPALPPLPYADVVTSAPGTMSCGRGGLQWVPSYGADVYQCSLPKPAFRFTQLPEMAMGSPPPLPPRTGPPPRTSLRRSTSDLGPKARSSETTVTEMRSQHDNNPYGPTTRGALPSITAEPPVSNYSGNPITAVYAIPATRPGFSEYFVSSPPTSYHSPSWMSYPPEPEDVPPQWADSVPLPGYVEAFPHPRYPQGSPTRLPLEYNPTLEQPPTAPSTASQQSLPQVLKDMDSMPLSSLSTSALVQAIRQEVAKLAKKQNDMFEF